jgi:hypothetical protein
VQHPARKQDAFFKGARHLVADEGFAVSVLAAVLATAILAFGFGATADVVISMLVVGVMTSLAEARLRTRK